MHGNRACMMDGSSLPRQAESVGGINRCVFAGPQGIADGNPGRPANIKREALWPSCLRH
jgi:hypothetical protein